MKGRFSVWTALPYGLVLCATVALLMLVERDKSAAYEAALTAYRADASVQSREGANQLEAKFRQIYQGIRTLARLPGVRSIDRYARNFDENARSSAQEIYNSLAESVAISEVYIVPVDFDPDALDPHTGKLQEPITTFDELIVGRTAERTAHHPAAGMAMQEPLAADEIEIHEYRLMREQIALLRAQFPSENMIDRLAYPAISGREVITCDNTRYSPSRPDDADRKGLVYSVPFFGVDGGLKGIVSAVILTAAIEDMLPGQGFVLHNHAYDYVARRKDTAVQAIHSARLYSELVPLAIADLSSGWAMRAALDDRHYWSGAGVVSAQGKAATHQVIVLVSALAMCLIIYALDARHGAAQARSRELEARILERTRDLALATEAANAANRAKSQFLSVMSHEIRTPLSAIIGMTDLLSHAALGQTQTRHLHAIQRSAGTLLTIINDVLDLAKIEAGRIELAPGPFAVRQIVADVAEMFAEQAAGKGLRIATVLHPDLPETILVDGARLRQVLINLIGNAVKFTSRGEIRLRASPGRSAPDGALTQIRFAVSDTGIGIAPGTGTAIFEPFTQGDTGTARAAGTGLGLSISRTLVAMMGGRLDYESELGKGSTFYFTIDTRPTASTSTGAAQDAEGAAQFSQALILMAEDNPVGQEVTRAYLERLGCIVAVAANGADAVTLAAQSRFHLILMDCQMPGTDGFEATRLIRKHEAAAGLAPVPIIALTANAFVEDRVRCVDAGMSDHLSKPFTAASLQKMLGKYLGAAKPDKSTRRI